MPVEIGEKVYGPGWSDTVSGALITVRRMLGMDLWHKWTLYCFFMNNILTQGSAMSGSSVFWTSAGKTFQIASFGTSRGSSEGPLQFVRSIATGEDSTWWFTTSTFLGFSTPTFSGFSPLVHSWIHPDISVWSITKSIQQFSLFVRVKIFKQESSWFSWFPLGDPKR